MKKIVKSYLSFIDNYESLMREKYNIEKNISLWGTAQQNIFDKQGVINNYKYSYHGAGCRLEKDTIICEYDSAPLNEFNVKFTLDKFLEYIETHPAFKEMGLNKDNVRIELYKLVNDNIISLYDFSKDFDIKTYPMAKYLELFQAKL